MCVCQQMLLTATLAWKSAVGTIGMGPPCLPNFLSKLSCTDTGRKNRGEKKELKRHQNNFFCFCIHIKYQWKHTQIIYLVNYLTQPYTVKMILPLPDWLSVNKKKSINGNGIGLSRQILCLGQRLPIHWRHFLLNSHSIIADVASTATDSVGIHLSMLQIFADWTVILTILYFLQLNPNQSCIFKAFAALSVIFTSQSVSAPRREKTDKTSPRPLHTSTLPYFSNHSTKDLIFINYFRLCNFHVQCESWSEVCLVASGNSCWTRVSAINQS